MEHKIPEEHKLSILIPIFNEEKTILEIYKQIKNSDISPVKKEIIIVDDSSTDNTFNILQNIKEENTIILRHGKNQGKGAAIRTALEKATGDIVIIQDADLEYDPNDYADLIRPILENKTDVVYGSRRLKKTNEQYSGFSFYIGGIALTYITNLIFRSNITDEPTCYKVFRTELLRSLNLTCKRFEFCPEVTAKLLRKKIKIIEIPISYRPRHSNEGKKIKWKDGVEAVLTLLKFKFSN